MKASEGHELSCADVPAALLLAADDELSSINAQLLERHLAHCSDCRQQQVLFGQVEQSVTECRNALDTIAPPHPARRVQTQRRPFVGNWQRMVLATAALVLVAVWVTSRVPRENPADVHTGHASVQPDGGGEPERAESLTVLLPLSPIGNPFSDGSTPDPEIRGELVIGSDGIRHIHLAN